MGAVTVTGRTDAPGAGAHLSGNHDHCQPSKCRERISLARIRLAGPRAGSRGCGGGGRGDLAEQVADDVVAELVADDPAVALGSDGKERMLYVRWCPGHPVQGGAQPSEVR